MTTWGSHSEPQDGLPIAAADYDRIRHHQRAHCANPARARTRAPSCGTIVVQAATNTCISRAPCASPGRHNTARRATVLPRARWTRSSARHAPPGIDPSSAGGFLRNGMAADFSTITGWTEGRAMGAGPVKAPEAVIRDSMAPCETLDRMSANATPGGALAEYRAGNGHRNPKATRRARSRLLRRSCVPRPRLTEILQMCNYTRDGALKPPPNFLYTPPRSTPPERVSRFRAVWGRRSRVLAAKRTKIPRSVTTPMNSDELQRDPLSPHEIRKNTMKIR